LRGLLAVAGVLVAVLAIATVAAIDQTRPVKVDAIVLLRQPAEQGDRHSQALLGFLYHTGQGVPRNDAEAIKWLRMAADQGDAEGASWLGSIYDEGQLLSTKDPILSQLTPDWLKQHPGVVPVVHIDKSGERTIVLCDYPEAVRWYRVAATHGNAAAMLSLGNMYRDGRGVEKDGAEAVHLYERAAEGVADPEAPAVGMAALNLALAYEKGDIVPRDDAAAVEWLQKSLAGSSRSPVTEIAAADELARLYSEGRGVRKDEEKAKALQARAAAAGQKLRQAQLSKQ